MSANDQYVIQEIRPNVFDIFHVDVDGGYARAVVRGVVGLRSAIKETEKERPAEYGYVVEFLEDDDDHQV